MNKDKPTEELIKEAGDQSKSQDQPNPEMEHSTETPNQPEEPVVEETVENGETTTASDEDEMMFARKKIKNLEAETKKLTNEVDELKNRLLRISAEYENFRKRTGKEKEELADTATCDVLKNLLPVIDNLERALVTETDDLQGLKDGVQMTLDSFLQIMKSFGVEEIDTDEPFDPNVHEAVMHEVDPEKGDKEITEVFLKGYKVGDRVIRHTVVKVVNQILVNWRCNQWLACIRTLDLEIV